MKKFLETLKKYWLAYLIFNLVIVVICVGIILYSLTYTSVPVNAQHLWYGTDLHTYLFWDHLFTTIGMFICMALITATVTLEYNKLDKKAKKEEKEEEK